MGGANEKSRSKGARAFQIDAGADALVLPSVFGVELWPGLGSAVSGALHLPFKALLQELGMGRT